MFRPGFKRLGLARIGQSYRVIKPSHTSELQAGDVVRITFPSMSAGSFQFGSSESFVVMGIDPSNGKVGLRDEDGSVLWIDGGSYSELLSRLSKKSSFDSIEILRASEASEYSANEMDLIGGAMLWGLPSGYGPLRAERYDDVREGDYVFSVSRSTGVSRLWMVYDGSDPEWIKIRLEASNSGDDTVGETNAAHRGDQIVPGNEMAFREGFLMPWEEAGIVPQASAARGIGMGTIALGVGAAVLLAVLLS